MTRRPGQGRGQLIHARRDEAESRRHLSHRTGESYATVGARAVEAEHSDLSRSGFAHVDLGFSGWMADEMCTLEI